MQLNDADDITTGFSPDDFITNDRTVVYEIIRECPKNEVVPLVHSRWIWITEDKYRCENCGDETRVDEVMEMPKYVYCPFCGARMDGEMIR